jgi:hypothetical protein
LPINRAKVAHAPVIMRESMRRIYRMSLSSVKSDRLRPFLIWRTNRHDEILANRDARREFRAERSLLAGHPNSWFER